MNKQEFEKENVFGLGEPNVNFAKYFIGNSYLNPLNKPGESVVFLANVTFEPGCRNNWHIHEAINGGGQILICTAGSQLVSRRGERCSEFSSRNSNYNYSKCKTLAWSKKRFLVFTYCS